MNHAAPLVSARPLALRSPRAPSTSRLCVPGKLPDDTHGDPTMNAIQENPMPPCCPVLEKDDVCDVLGVELKHLGGLVVGPDNGVGKAHGGFRS